MENLREYKGYMITSGYEEKVIDKEFGKLAHVSRKDVLYKKKRENRKKDARKYRFVTAYEPAFPDIKIVLMKHQHILKDDAELSKVFPNGAKDFQVSERRKAKNIKEILAKSKVRMLTNDERERLEEFELYWQMNLITYEPHGMNKPSETEKTRAKMKNRRIRDTKRK